MRVDTARFYADLPGFADFEGFTEFDAYSPVPSDWVVLCGDIRGSTQAIAEGRYKAVNMVGAAVITAVLNACRGTDVPFVFGGDGGAVVVPEEARDRAELALRKLQGHSESAFGLGLRAAAVPVARLRAEGVDLRVRKLTLGAGNSLAMFAGGGIEHAERILKSAPEGDPALLWPDSTTGPDLDGLSCRWEPLAASRGQMIALIIRPCDRDRAGEIFRDVLAQLAGVLGGAIADFAPATDRTLRFRWPPRGLRLEARATAGRRGFPRAYAWALVTSALQVWCEWRGRQIGPYDALRYRSELKAQTDFRKYDGTLRAVLDVTPDQAKQIEFWLEGLHRQRLIVYGLHRDRQALMTCLVFSLERGEHIHFIDAAGGGFARAAEDFKMRMRGAG